MPRRARSAPGGLVYHVLNRAAGRQKLFTKPQDYDAFERVMELAFERVPGVRLLGYALMPTHWHMVLWPGKDGELSELLRWMTVTHAQRHHAHRHSAGRGPVYQGRFKSFPVQSDEHLRTVLRYVERNPLRADLVERAERWRWSSLWRTCHATQKHKMLLCPWPVERPRNWLDYVNRPQTEAELAALRTSVRRSRPFGDERWTAVTAARLGLQWTLNPRGRPPKPQEAGR